MILVEGPCILQLVTLESECNAGREGPRWTTKGRMMTVTDRLSAMSDAFLFGKLLKYYDGKDVRSKVGNLGDFEHRSGLFFDVTHTHEPYRVKVYVGFDGDFIGQVIPIIDGPAKLVTADDETELVKKLDVAIQELEEWNGHY